MVMVGVKVGVGVLAGESVSMIVGRGARVGVDVEARAGVKMKNGVEVGGLNGVLAICLGLARNTPPTIPKSPSTQRPISSIMHLSLIFMSMLMPCIMGKETEIQCNILYMYMGHRHCSIGAVYNQKSDSSN